MCIKTIMSISADTMEAGKSTFCHVFRAEAEKNGLKVVELHFAEPLKRTLAEMMRYVTGEDPNVIYKRLCDDSEFKAAKAQPEAVFGGKTVREILQLMGTEFGRELINPEIWVEMLKTRALIEFNSGADIILVDDTRFRNEYGALERLANTEGFSFVDVFISRDSQKEKNEEQNIQKHKSEGELDFLKYSAKVSIDNNSSLYEYKRKCAEISRGIIYSLQNPLDKHNNKPRYLYADFKAAEMSLGMCR